MTDWKRVGVVIAGLGFAVSLLMNVSTIVKATPDRAEIVKMNDDQNARLEFFITLLQEDIARMDDKLDRLIERGEGN